MTLARASIGVAAATIALLTVLVVPASEFATYAGQSWLMATADVWPASRCSRPGS